MYPIMPGEFREHLTRDQRPFLHPESLQILQIHRSITVLLLFSSLTHILQGPGQRTHLLQGSGQRTGTAMIAEAWFCAQWPICVVFEVCVWIIVRLEDLNMAHYTISNRVSKLLDFLSVGIWLNPWCHVSKQDVQDLQQKYRNIINIYPPWVFAAKKQIFSFIWL